MEFRSALKAQKAPFSIHYPHASLWLGSCFTQAIGQRMADRKFDALINPFGNIFNPLSIALHLQASVDATCSYMASDFVFSQNAYFSWQHHSSITAKSLQQIENICIDLYQQSHLHLKKSKFLFITFGSAWAYRLKTSQKLVANCHKWPQQQFDKMLLSVDEIVASFEMAIAKLLALNPEIEIVLTVSPVKHLRDGIIENNRSKAVLLLAAHTLCEKNSHCSYFPAFELINDDLRDYRFYAEDLVHPNEIAEKYVWEYFKNTYFLPTTQALVNEVEKILLSMKHKVQQEDSPAHLIFENKLKQQIEQLRQKGINI